MQILWTQLFQLNIGHINLNFPVVNFFLFQSRENMTSGIQIAELTQLKIPLQDRLMLHRSGYSWKASWDPKLKQQTSTHDRDIINTT